MEAVARKFKNVYEIERERKVQITEMTSKIEAKLAGMVSKRGLELLMSNDIRGAMEQFVKALYLNPKDKTALEGINSVKDTAKTLYWKAYGMRETNKSEARKILQNLIQSILPTNEFYIKSRALLEEIQK